MTLQRYEGLSEAERDRIERLVEAATQGPWFSYVAGRDAAGPAIGLEAVNGVAFGDDVSSGAGEAESWLDRVANAVLSIPTSRTVSVSYKSSGFQGDPKDLLFRAAGGPVSARNAYVVGEQGPELFLPDTNGMIVPNHALASAAGGGGWSGGGTTVVNVDMRGAIVPGGIHQFEQLVLSAVNKGLDRGEVNKRGKRL